jgi:hypothetical protein
VNVDKDQLNMEEVTAGTEGEQTGDKVADLAKNVPSE